MKAKDQAEKQQIKFRYAAALEKALKESQFDSYRSLATHIGFEPAHIQRIATGKTDVVLTTSVSLAEGLGISFEKFASYYDNITSREIEVFLRGLELRKKSPKKKNSGKSKPNKKK